MIGGPALILSALDVLGAGSCPNRAEVEARLAVLLPDARIGERVEVAEDAAAGTLRVRLLDAHGARTLDRTLQASGSCDDRAETVAVVVAAWLTERHPELTAPSAAREQPGPTSATLALGLGIAGAVDGLTTPVPGLLVDGAAFATNGWGLGIEAWGTGGRHAPIGDAAVRWMRAAVGVGPRERFGRGATGLELRQALLLTMTRAQGEGLAAPRRDLGAALALAAGARVVRRFANTSLWLDAEIARLLSAQTARATMLPTGDHVEVPLPDWLALVALGIGWSSEP